MTDGIGRDHPHPVGRDDQLTNDHEVDQVTKPRQPINPHPVASSPCVQTTIDKLRAEDSSSRKRVVAQYELYLTSEEQLSTSQRPLHKEWSCMELVHQEGSGIGLLFSHKGSKKLLFTELPERREGAAAGVFLFGSHAGQILCLTCNLGYAVSGCDMGSIKLWGLKEGSLLDVKGEDKLSRPRITSVELIGPLMVAAGNSDGQVTVYDSSSNKLMAVQCFFVDTGPVTALAACIPVQLRHSIALAEGPRSADGGGTEASTTALLAIASSAGWFHIYQPTSAGESAWERQYSGTHTGSISMKFCPGGEYLAISSGNVMLLNTSTWASAHSWHFLSPPIATGFWPGSEGESLTTMQSYRGAQYGGADHMSLEPAVRLGISPMRSSTQQPSTSNSPAASPQPPLDLDSTSYSSFQPPPAAASPSRYSSFQPPPAAASPSRYSSFQPPPAAASPSRYSSFQQLPAAASPTPSRGVEASVVPTSARRPITMPVMRSWKDGGAVKIGQSQCPWRGAGSMKKL
eukprot:gene22546-29672_t